MRKTSLPGNGVTAPVGIFLSNFPKKRLMAGRNPPTPAATTNFRWGSSLAIPTNRPAKMASRVTRALAWESLS
jgi:hypothetical protein